MLQINRDQSSLKCYLFSLARFRIDSVFKTRKTICFDFFFIIFEKGVSINFIFIYFESRFESIYRTNYDTAHDAAIEK
jgi:hypothetical protein